MAELLLVAGFVLAVAFTVVNGFHDASNANALPVRFNALTPRVRFAAFCRVIALGQERTQDIPSLAVQHADRRIPRLSRTANELDAAAKAWRNGTLD